MSYIKKEEFMEAIKNSKPLTPEQKRRAKELSEKMKQISYEEQREMCRKLDEEDGYM